MFAVVELVLEQPLCHTFAGTEAQTEAEQTLSNRGDINPDDKASYAGSKRSSDQLAALRILDANLNRATEGLRVVEDYCRFALDDLHLARRCKEIRHDLVSALSPISSPALAAAREAQQDVGAEIATPQEGNRQSLAHVAAASWQRVQQALRVIDECVKLLAPAAAASIERLRYQSYTLAKACLTAQESDTRLLAAQLQVLMDGAKSERSFIRRVNGLIASGVSMIQLRDKRLADRKLLSRAKLLRQLIDEAGGGVLLIVNDRPDLAVLSRADGLHIGQDELTVKDARLIVGPQMLIGVSTHSIEQARQAVLDGANYIGCGPTFPSSTKEFEKFPGLPFLQEVAGEISLPAFAIGGISLKNVHDVVATGVTRIAVSSAVMAAEDRSEAVHTLLAALREKH
jgi:thiamine-phosphate pyrophosphorylase